MPLPLKVIARRGALPALLTLAVAGCGTARGSTDAAGGPVEVKAGDSSCALSRTQLTAGTNVFRISNTGSKVTEVYVFGEGDRILTEKEDIAPGLDYELTASIPAGSYEVACKPGQTGNGIRTRITVVGAGAGAAPSQDPASARAVAGYRRFVQAQADALVPLVGRFAAAVRSGDVGRAKALYAPSRAPWEAIEPVAESFGDLDPKIDRREADLEPGEQWSGWHRIEKALWRQGSVEGLGPVAERLVADVATFRTRVATADLTAASIGNGAKELLDEVATRKITGEEEAFSHTDLIDVVANVRGARAAADALRPLVQRGDPALVATIDSAFTRVDRALAVHRRGGSYVSYASVDPAGRRALARSVDALGEPLSRLAAAATRPAGTAGAS